MSKVVYFSLLTTLFSRVFINRDTFNEHLSQSSSFQIEENTKQYAESQGSQAVSDPRRRSSGWKVGARNALLQWCKEIITPKFGIHVENFGSSWRDGRAFVALISALNPGKSSVFQANICKTLLQLLFSQICLSNWKTLKDS